MRNKKWLVLFFLSLLSLSILTMSCAKNTVKPDEYSTQGTVEESDIQPDQVNQQAIEGEGLQAASEIEIRAAKEELETENIYFNKKRPGKMGFRYFLMTTGLVWSTRL